MTQQLNKSANINENADNTPELKKPTEIFKEKADDIVNNLVSEVDVKYKLADDEIANALANLSTQTITDSIKNYTGIVDPSLNRLLELGTALGAQMLTELVSGSSLKTQPVKKKQSKASNKASNSKKLSKTIKKLKTAKQDLNETQKNLNQHLSQPQFDIKKKNELEQALKEKQELLQKAQQKLETTILYSPELKLPKVKKLIEEKITKQKILKKLEQELSESKNSNYNNHKASKLQTKQPQLNNKIALTKKELEEVEQKLETQIQNKFEIPPTEKAIAKKTIVQNYDQHTAQKTFENQKKSTQIKQQIKPNLKRLDDQSIKQNSYFKSLKKETQELDYTNPYNYMDFDMDNDQYVAGDYLHNPYFYG
jgi:hypothetical protein